MPGRHAGPESEWPVPPYNYAPQARERRYKRDFVYEYGMLGLVIGFAATTFALLGYVLL